MNELFKIAEAMIDRAAENMPRAAPFRAKSFAAWELGEGNGANRKELNATTLDEAVALQTPPIMPVAEAKGGFPSFVILETDHRASDGEPAHKLHVFNIKVRRDWRAIGPLGSAQKAAIPYAVHAGSLAMKAFEPRRRFSTRAGDDPITGRQPDEQRVVEIAPEGERR